MVEQDRLGKAFEGVRQRVAGHVNPQAGEE